MWPKRTSGQALVEHVVLWPVLILITMAVIQLGLLYRGKVTLEHAAFMAAREGSINNAFKAPMKKMLASAMAPLDMKANPNVASYALRAGAGTVPGTTYAENFTPPMVAGGADIEILSPSRAVFNQFAKDQYVLEACSSNCPKGGAMREARTRIQQIPNDNLSVRPSTATTVGTGSNASTVNIQDANLLKIRAHWCFPLQVPVVNIAIYQTLKLLGVSAETRSCQAKTVAHNAAFGYPIYYIPLSAGSLMRMQSPVRCEDASCTNLGAGGVAASSGHNGTGANPGEGNNTGNSAGGDAGNAGSNSDGDNTGGDNHGSVAGDPVNEGDAGSDPVSCDGGASSTNGAAIGASGAATSLTASNAPSFTTVGNPIDLGTGNKYQREKDYIGIQVDALFFVRSYNSVLAHRDMGLGAGWRYSYQRAIVFDTNTLTAKVWRDDGTQYVFPIKDRRGIAPVGVIDQLERLDTGWRYRIGNGDIETYDEQGRLLRVDYPSGIAHTLTYDAEGHLHSIYDTRGNALTLYWHAQHLDHVELPTRQRLDYAYDRAMNLRSVSRSSSFLDRLFAGFKIPERRYHYEDRRFTHALTGLDDATGARYATWAYDEQGRGILSQHGDGAGKITIDYQPRGALNASDGLRRVAVSNARGLTVLYALEPMRPGKYRLKDIDGQPMRECPQIQAHHRYDANGFVRLQWNADRIGSTYMRNDRGLIEVEQHGLRVVDNEQMEATAGATRTERQWDQTRPWLLSETHLTWAHYPNKNVGGHWQPTFKREFNYDERGRVLADTVTDVSEQVIPYSTKGQQRTRTYRYTFADAAKTQLNAFTLLDDKNKATTYRYQHDQLQSITNALNQTTQFERYNNFGQAEVVTLPNGQRLRIHYNERGLPAKLERGNGESTEVTQAEYSAIGQLLHLTRFDGSEQFYRYNAAGQLIQINNGWGEQINLRLNALNGQWEELQLLDAQGQMTQQHKRRFNGLGQLAALVGNDGQLIEFNHDSSGNLITASERDIHDAHTDIAHTTQAQYDTQHRLLELIDAAGYRTHYDYSASGHIEAVTDANKNTTEYLRNGFGDIIEQTSQTTGSVIKRYDQNGNLIENAGLAGEGIKFEYDALNRLTKVDYPGEQNDIRYTYDQTDNAHGNGLQQLTQIETPRQIIDYRYDDFGRKIQEATIDKPARTGLPPLPAGEGRGEGALSDGVTTLKYHYRSGNRLDQITYPDGSAVHYHFDKDRITEVTYTAADDKSHAEKTLIKDIAYAPFGGPIRWTYGNGLTRTQQFDQDGRVTAIALTQNKNKHQNENTALWSQHYEYDLYQNIQTIKHSNDVQHFAYDKMDRLIQEQSNEGNKKYVYDLLGNRKEEVLSGKPINYEYSSQGQMTSRANAALTHDDAGNLVKEFDPVAQRDRRFAYNAQNKPAAIYDHEQVTAHYRYNALGWRYQKTTYRQGERQRTRFSYTQDGKLLSENAIEASNKSINYVWLGAHPIARITQSSSDTQIIYLHDDHLAAPRVATNDQQKIIWRWHSDAFGNGSPDEDPDHDDQLTQINLRFPGQYADAESGLNYNLHRYYDPVKGRYTQSDPLGPLASMNTYSYVDANPVNWLDPLGLAKLQYVLIDSFGGDPTNASKSTLKSGTDSRMPHFAFMLTDIAGANGASLIYDPNGIETQTKEKGWYGWNSGGLSPWVQFRNFYEQGYGGKNAFNTGDWAIVNDFDDGTAAELYHNITGVYPGDYKPAEGACALPASNLMPALPAGFYAMEHFNFPTIVHKLTKPIFDAKDLPAANDVEFLNVPWFQGTFNNEGKDIPSDKNTYSRIPKKLVDRNGNAIGNSGVTLGRGFDLGTKNPITIRRLMTRIGLSSSQVNTLVDAVGHHGADHVTYFDAHKDALTAIELTREQQYLLYMYAIKNKADDAKTGRYEKDMQGPTGAAWEDLDEKIRMLMTDLNYRGDLTDANRATLKDAVSTNDLKAVCTVMSNQKYWVRDHGVPQTRFEERKSIVCE